MSVHNVDVWVVSDGWKRRGVGALPGRLYLDVQWQLQADHWEDDQA